MNERPSQLASPPGFPSLLPIPRARYVDSRLYKLELDMVFRRSWLVVGHSSEFAETGSYRSFVTPIGPILMVRGEDGTIRAFLNTCRHRGAPVAHEGCGKARVLACQYHGWIYRLDGKLRGVPGHDDFPDSIWMRIRLKPCGVKAGAACYSLIWTWMHNRRTSNVLA